MIQAQSTIVNPEKLSTIFRAMIGFDHQPKEATAMISRRVIAMFLLALTLAFGNAGCSKKQEEAAPASAGPTWKPSGNEGNITGVIAFTGQPPAPRKLDTSNDAACGEAMADDVLVNNGKLQNVFVYVKSGLPEVNFEVPTTEVELDQQGCK
jgi:hypothetical protein